MDCPNVSFEVDLLRKTIIEEVSKRLNITQSEFLRSIIDVLAIEFLTVLRFVIGCEISYSLLNQCIELEDVVNELEKGQLSNEGRKKLVNFLGKVFNYFSINATTLVPILFTHIPLYFTQGLSTSLLSFIEFLKSKLGTTTEIKEKILIEHIPLIQYLDRVISYHIIINDLVKSLPFELIITSILNVLSSTLPKCGSELKISITTDQEVYKSKLEELMKAYDIFKQIIPILGTELAREDILRELLTKLYELEKSSKPLHIIYDEVAKFIYNKVIQHELVQRNPKTSIYLIFWAKVFALFTIQMVDYYREYIRKKDISIEEYINTMNEIVKKFRKCTKVINKIAQMS